MISDAKKFLGDFAGAYHTLVRSKEIDRELYSATVRNEIGSMRLLMKLEREEHEREIAHMKNEQTERDLTNSTLQLLR